MRNDSGTILIVDDDDVEALLVKRSFEKLNMTKKIEHVRNGLEAIQYLESGSRPSIILLDINMPIMNGLEFLKKRDENEDWVNIPVVVFTSSDRQSDKKSALQLGASGYMIKPVDFESMCEMLKAIITYWTFSEQLVD